MVSSELLCQTCHCMLMAIDGNWPHSAKAGAAYSQLPHHLLVIRSHVCSAGQATPPSLPHTVSPLPTSWVPLYYLRMLKNPFPKIQHHSFCSLLVDSPQRCSWRISTRQVQSMMMVPFDTSATLCPYERILL